MYSIVIDKLREVTPTKIICVGRNYVSHIKELGNPMPQQMVVFCKPNSASATQLHAEHLGDAIEYEGELCFIVEKGQFSALGFGFDLTKRQLQGELKRQGLPWERAKAFDGSAVFSQFVSLADLPKQITFQLSRNNRLVQSGDSQLMLYKPEEILSEVSRFMQLNDGDVIMTGTPEGVGPITKGDHFSVKVLIGDQTVIKQSWVTA